MVRTIEPRRELRPVQDGDYVSIDLRATVDGEEVEGGSTTGLSYEVGTGSLIRPGVNVAPATGPPLKFH